MAKTTAPKTRKPRAPKPAPSEWTNVNFYIRPAEHRRAKRMTLEIGDDLEAVVRFQEVLRLGLVLVADAWDLPAPESDVPPALLDAARRRLRRAS